MLKKIFILTVFAALLLSTRANAQVNLFTEHQVIHMVQHGVNKNQDVRFPTGDYPYIGQLGIEYEQNKNLSYSLSYIHRSNVDISGRDEYNYNGVAVGAKLKHCLINCP